MSILTSIYALLMYPAVQAKAFEEIHRVIGHDRLPTLADLDNLPYMEAFWKETLRWSPPLPISESSMHILYDRTVTKNINSTAASHN